MAVRWGGGVVQQVGSHNAGKFGLTNLVASARGHCIHPNPDSSRRKALSAWAHTVPIPHSRESLNRHIQGLGPCYPLHLLFHFPSPSLFPSREHHFLIFSSVPSITFSFFGIPVSPPAFHPLLASAAMKKVVRVSHHPRPLGHREPDLSRHSPQYYQGVVGSPS